MVKTPSERDESLERWLRRLGPARRAATGPCLDAETAAAWAGGGLTGASLEQAQSHAADCARCQAMVGALIRAEAGGQTAEPARESPRWLGWLVPLTAAAAASIAVALWVTLPRQAGSTASSAVESFPSPPVAARQAVPSAAEPQAGARVDERASLNAAVAVPDASGAAVGASQSVPSLAKAEEGRARSLDAARIEADAAGPAALAAAAPPLAATPVASPAFADAPAAVDALARAQNRASAPGSIEFASPDRTVRWRLTGSGVERSVDAGATWAPVPTGVTTTFTAGSAPSPTICWLTGQGGMVLVTTDGVSWRRVPFPEPADLATVSASDAQTATITTTDGRTFRTNDSGTLWTR